MSGQQLMFWEQDKEQEEFLDKFKPKLTTDDCFTPPLIYDAVRDWACREYDLDPADIVRPFYPGGDYVRFPYPTDCVVLDNPPFSIVTQICEFYFQKNIRFFLFAPGLTIFSGRKICEKICHIGIGQHIKYQNGAVPNTGFVTNLNGDVVARSAPELSAAIQRAAEEIKRGEMRTLPKYEYPKHVLTANDLQKFSRYGVEFSVRRVQCMQISKLDSQAPAGKSIFGHGLLLSNKAAAEKAAAEKAAAHVWNLSEREIDLINRMDGGSGND